MVVAQRCKRDVQRDCQIHRCFDTSLFLRAVSYERQTGGSRIAVNKLLLHQGTCHTSSEHIPVAAAVKCEIS